MVTRNILSPAQTLLLLLLAFVILTPPITPTPRVDLDSLLAESVGGPSAVEILHTLTSHRTVGTVIMNEQPGDFEMIYARPDKVYIGVDFGDFTITQAYDGHTAWQRDINGAVVELGGYEAKELAKQAYFHSYSYVLEDRLPGDGQYRGIAEIEGVKYHQIALYPLNLDTVLQYLDLETARPIMTISRLDNMETRTVADDFRQVSGILMPFHSRTEAVEAPLVTEFLADSVQVNIPVDESIFRMPLEESEDARFPAGVGKVIVPFKFEYGHIYITAVINGKKKARFILDSGASTNLLNAPTIADLNLPVVGSLPAKGIGGYQNVQLVRTDSITIGDLTLMQQKAGSVAMSGLGRPADDGTPFGGVLGFDFLSRFPVLIDYSREVLTVFDPDGFVSPTGGAEVPFFLTMQVPTVEAELLGTTGSFLVDLGNAFGLVLHKEFLDDNNLTDSLKDIQPLPGSLAGIGKSLGSKTAFVESFRLETIRIDSVRVLLPDGGQGVSGSEELAGNIGNLLLKEFRVLFDYKSNRLLFYAADNDSK